MVQYIVQLATDIIRLMGTDQRSKVAIYLPELLRELDKLDARDFIPDARHEFVVAVADCKSWVRFAENVGINLLLVHDDVQKMELQQVVHRVIRVLGKYGGEGWRVKSRAFAFVKDANLKEIIERDYKELTLVLFPGGAWKSTVIMAGSILEAILFDQLTSDPTVKARAIASPKAPRNRATGVVWDVEDWRLEHFIDVAADLNIIDQNRERSFDQVLRDYRNFVHPKKEIRSKHPCREGEAQMAIGALNAICDVLKP